jgi:hypothetical protein
MYWMNKYATNTSGLLPRTAKKVKMKIARDIMVVVTMNWLNTILFAVAGGFFSVSRSE